MADNFLQQLLVPSFQELLHLGHELVSDRAINYPMVIADAEVHHRANGDRVVAVFVGNHHRLLLDAAHAHDGNLRLVDDRHAELGAKDARVGDSEGSTLHLVWLQLLGAGALAEIADSALQADKAPLFGILHHGHDEPPIESNRDTQIDRGVVMDVVAFHRRVDDGELANAVYHGAREERREGELVAGGLLELRFHPFAQLYDARDIHLKDTVHVGAGALRQHHVLGNLLAHYRHGYDFARRHTCDGLQR